MATAIKTAVESKPMAENLVFKRNKDREMVRGKFIFHEVPGGKMSFPFRAYKGDPIVTYNMSDGEVLSIPIGVAKHLNNNCWYPAYDFKSNEEGRPACTVVSKIRRCSFQSLEFLDIEGVAPIGSSLNQIQAL